MMSSLTSAGHVWKMYINYNFYPNVKTDMYHILNRNFLMFFFSHRCLICMLLIIFYSCYSFSFNNQQMTSYLCLQFTPFDCQGYKSLLQNKLYSCIKVLCQIYIYMYIWTLILTAKHYFLELIKIAVVRLVLMNFKLHYPMVRLY